ISERVPSVRSVALGFWIGAGSRDETEAKAGVSHFIEHMLFKGSQRYTAQEIAEIFDGLGGELNAATSREHTMVYARVPDNHVQQALGVITDMVFAPTFSDLDAEREVVLEEIAMYEDTPQELVHDLFSEAVFGRHALGRPVIGTADVFSFASQYTDTGLVGIYLGTREENLAPCLEITGDQLADIAGGNIRAAELARAKENLKGRIMLSMESTSNRMSRLGKSLITDTELLSFERIIAEIDAVDADEVAELAGLLLQPEKLSISGIGPTERVFRAAV